MDELNPNMTSVSKNIKEVSGNILERDKTI